LLRDVSRYDLAVIIPIVVEEPKNNLIEKTYMVWLAGGLAATALQAPTPVLFGVEVLEYQPSQY
jgi:hypothetical protein